MRKIKIHHYPLNDRMVLACCTVMMGVALWFDLKIPWAIGSMLYVPVVILSLQASNDIYPGIFSVIASLLIAIGLVVVPPDLHAVRAVTNHMLVVIILWATTFLGLQYKRGRDARLALASIVDSSHDAIIGKTLHGVVTSWNRGAEALFGYLSGEIIGKSINAIIPDDKKQEEVRLLEKAGAGESVEHDETVRKTKTGRLIHVSLTLSPIKDASGTVVGISSISRDITERIVAARKLKQLNDRIEWEKNKLEEVLAVEQHINIIFDSDKLIDFVVEKTAQLLEAEKCSLMLVDHITGELCIKGAKGIDEGVLMACRPRLGDPVAGLVAQKGEPVLVADIETDERFARSNRASYEGKSFISAPIKLGGTLMGVINVADKRSQNGVVFQEIDLKILQMIVRQVAIAMENAKLYRELKHLTVTDPLTYIYNYRQFTRSLDHEIKRLQRYSRPLCLLMIDIDNFKSYNDAFEHLEGDALLKEISRILNTSIRGVDTACRYAGDEFVVILPETDSEEAVMVAQKIKKATSDLPLKRNVTVSIGIAKCTPAMSRYDLILRADTALLEAKKKGKDTIITSG